MLWLLLYVFSSLIPAAVKAGVEDEQLKAVYIVNFLKFIHFTRKSQEGILVCFFADERFSEYFKQVSGVSVRGKALRVRKLEASSGLSDCEVLYVDVMHDATAQGLIQEARKEGILDIGNGFEFVESGGLIGFSVRNNKLGFNINVQQAKARGIQFSASLLELAHNVVH